MSWFYLINNLMYKAGRSLVCCRRVWGTCRGGILTPITKRCELLEIDTTANSLVRFQGGSLFRVMFLRFALEGCATELED